MDIYNKINLYLSKRRLCRRIKNKKINIKLLHEIDLSCMNLSNHDLSGAKMTKSNLSYIHL